VAGAAVTQARFCIRVSAPGARTPEGSANHRPAPSRARERKKRWTSLAGGAAQARGGGGSPLPDTCGWTAGCSLNPRGNLRFPKRASRRWGQASFRWRVSPAQRCRGLWVQTLPVSLACSITAAHEALQAPSFIIGARQNLSLRITVRCSRL
jgi:hypothetical protein